LVNILTSVILATAVIALLSARAVKRDGYERYLYNLLILGFLARVLIAVLVLHTDLIPLKYYSDSLSYQGYALRILEGIDIQENPEVYNFAWLLSRLFLVMGPAQLTAHILVSILSVVIIRNVYRTTEILAGNTAAAIVAGVWTLLPSIVFV